MTRNAKPVREPHSKGVYVSVAILAAICGFLFLWAAFTRVSLTGRPLETPLVWRLAQAGTAAIFLLAAMQAFERWLAPARAQARSAAISDKARSRFLLLRSVLVTTGVAGYAVYFVLYIAGSRVPDIFIVSAVLMLAGVVIADLCGCSFSPYRFR